MDGHVSCTRVYDNVVLVLHQELASRIWQECGLRRAHFSQLRVCRA